ncbi:MULTISPECIES: PDDEXK-like family protein [unclassified Campylobacter]|uniref:PDDEXK-like family protein n=1 Tax=unclassified Campylobacter TaxID=2593542 RepID=UPI0022EA03BB|nr:MULTISPECIES: PD-(D/E)XK nuclease family protein [unclassified Campylobacter]MDA3056141.1 PD-(D/E)XK nuclease family protein [Campylobacter sp. CN_NA1]MDA3065286.1 PD-(D/E)XK nuclease family protein [Campylobacter sp. CN_NE4]MDA3068111.1 PD-(D/E)XK nuclease family protein [Campylobacter sp. CN_NE3]MDA3082739.1 PD-(D/E)XK nuclease family protein [Campylobacter sp. CN_EL2]MDA3083522.1 PD-(D/E)XK nuclease family protein [Campylobacter sp. CN_NE1]
MADELSEKFKKIKEQAKILKNEFETRKLRGINEFNIFSVLRKENDEVGLHSKFIYSLLNPLEKHYQKDLFLKLFLKTIELKNFINLRNAKVYMEYKNIDIYMTDGENHIILENKIYAADQEKQIQRYIDEIKAKPENKPENKLFVLYLSLDRENPSKYSLGEYRLNDEKNQILDENGIFIAKFKSIHYGTEIKTWLEMCLNEVGNITNLSLYIRDYSKIIDKICGNYKELVMETKELWNKENYEVLKAITENSDKDREKVFENFINKIQASNIYKNSRIEYEQFGNDNGFNIIINEKDNFVFRFAWYFGCKKPYFGIYSKNRNIDENEKEQLKLKGFVIYKDRFANKDTSKFNQNNNDLVDYFFTKNEAIQEFTKYIKDEFDTYKNLLDELNSN